MVSALLLLLYFSLTAKSLYIFQKYRSTVINIGTFITKQTYESRWYVVFKFKKDDLVA
jgi:hypothetical protein